MKICSFTRAFALGAFTLGAFALGATLWCGVAHAQEAPGGGAADASPAPISPDRPGFTNGSDTVAPGRVILESGFARTRDRDSNGGGTTDDFPESLLRFGVTRRLELQVGVPDYNVSHDGPRGFGDLFLGAKIKLYERGQTVAAVVPGLNVPFGRRDFRTFHVQPSVLFGVDRALGQRARVSANLVLSETEQPGKGGNFDANNGALRNQFTVTPAASLAYELTPKLGAFVDSYAIVPRHGGSIAALDGGFTYLLNNNLQLDVEYGHGLGGADSPAHFFGGGVAVRF